MRTSFLLFLIPLSFILDCRKGPSLSRDEVKELSQSYIRELCKKNLECSAEYIEALPSKEQDSAKSGFSSLDQCMIDQKDQTILPDDYEKVTDDQIAKVKRCMDDLLKTPCTEMEQSGGIPSCRELFPDEG
ncbi:hypothetical protein EHQ53_18165 [Leptospira langatensis]|uniref:Uncharacterized protein n=1 Tax=Leptospira langatensis TaxID=2484983 RepID=A0A5F1ZPP4_9LEPT|nr:hypothetical protein [Leptospira langatensis]TGK05544.1 hypothetical protein EHO57_02405 [Leptospira langatensis]TGL38677.1 hypothetical protein EHQ53_18165 [Leptospira langatensis]